MTVGDILRPRPPKIPKVHRYPETRATGEMFAGSLTLSYSYAQHSGTHLGFWGAPPSRDRVTWEEISGSETTIAWWPWEPRAQHTEIICGVWYGFEPEDVPDPVPLELRLRVDGIALGIAEAPIGDETQPTIARNDLDHYPTSGLLKAEVSVAVDGEGLEGVTRFVRINAQRAVPARVTFVSASIWARGDPNA